MKILQKPFCAWWYIFNAFVPTFMVAFRTTYGQNNTRKCATEVFLPVTILNDAVGSLSLFIKSLNGSTGNMICCIHSYEINIRFQNSCMYHQWMYVTSTCPLFPWCYRYSNFKWISRVLHQSLNYMEGKSVPASAEIISKYHQPNLSIFLNLDWSISNLSITYSVVFLSIP